MSRKAPLGFQDTFEWWLFRHFPRVHQIFLVLYTASAVFTTWKLGRNHRATKRQRAGWIVLILAMYASPTVQSSIYWNRMRIPVALADIEGLVGMKLSEATVASLTRTAHGMASSVSLNVYFFYLLLVLLRTPSLAVAAMALRDIFFPVIIPEHILKQRIIRPFRSVHFFETPKGVFILAIAVPLLAIALRAVVILRQRASLSKAAKADVNQPMGVRYVWDDDAFRRNIVPELAGIGSSTVFVFLCLLPTIAPTDVALNLKVQGEMMGCVATLAILNRKTVSLEAQKSDPPNAVPGQTLPLGEPEQGEGGVERKVKMGA